MSLTCRPMAVITEPNKQPTVPRQASASASAPSATAATPTSTVESVDLAPWTEVTETAQDVPKQDPPKEEEAPKEDSSKELRGDADPAKKEDKPKKEDPPKEDNLKGYADRPKKEDMPKEYQDRLKNTGSKELGGKEVAPRQEYVPKQESSKELDHHVSARTGEEARETEGSEELGGVALLDAEQCLAAEDARVTLTMKARSDKRTTSV